MRISVECGGFTRAADACLTANQTSAVLTESLTSRLAACTEMAGDDATSAGFTSALLRRRDRRGVPRMAHRGP